MNRDFVSAVFGFVDRYCFRSDAVCVVEIEERIVFRFAFDAPVRSFAGILGRAVPEVAVALVVSEFAVGSDKVMTSPTRW